MCSLRPNDGIRPELTPWLASLYVEPDFRGQGIAVKLIKDITQKAKSLGYHALYLLAFDEALPNWYEKQGWQKIGQDAVHFHPVTLMSLSW